MQGAGRCRYRKKTRCKLSHHRTADQQGRTIFSTRYPIGDFSEGLAIFWDEDGFRGFLDKTGAIAIPAQFFEAKPFSEGLARVSRLDAQGYEQYGFIDKAGAVVIPLQYKSVQEAFQDGLVGAQPNDSALWGYLDKAGEWAIKAKKQQSNGVLLTARARLRSHPNTSHPTPFTAKRLEPLLGLER